MPVLGAARAGRHQRARALELDHADAADVDRARASRRSRAWACRCRARDRRRGSSRPRRPRPARPSISSVDACRVHAPRSVPGRARAARWPSAIATAAVWPRPQIEASRHAAVDLVEQRELVVDAAPRAAGRAGARAPPPGARCRPGRARTGRTTRRGRTRRSAAGCRARPPCRRAPSPRPSRGSSPASRAASNVSGTSSWSGPTNDARRAAEQHGLERTARRRTPPASSISSRSVMPERSTS